LAEVIPETRAPVLSVLDLSVDYRSPGGTVHALRNVSLSIKEGEIFGVVGESGSGKSTLALAVAHLLDYRVAGLTGGKINLLGVDMSNANRSTVNSLRGTGVFMVFQDPFMSLDPLETIGNQLLEAISVRMKRSSERFEKEAAVQMAIQCLQSVRIGDAENMMRRYPHQLSGGQNQRIMLAMAVAESPKLLIADEPTTALDVTTQGQILNLLKQIVAENKMSVLYITHDLAVAGSICDRIAVLYGGMVQEMGPTREVLLSPEHPYTVGLIDSIPSKSKKSGNLNAISGSFSWQGVEDKCAFAPRCPLAHDICSERVPVLIQRGNRSVRCVNYA
jgi:peptide/nickel transport system ATP-binding protein